MSPAPDRADGTAAPALPPGLFLLTYIGLFRRMAAFGRLGS